MNFEMRFIGSVIRMDSLEPTSKASIKLYSVIKKDGLKFVRLYILNYIRHVNDLHNI